ncbi:MAG: ABC transporter substrate-binding protein/permease, partial [Eubacterium sp.]|nr:ABC transporter substrate-binding protein/permease [Eubacterium sp.]
ALIVRKDGPLGGSVEASTSADDLEFHSLKELEGRPFASIRGGIQETMVPEYLPGAQPVIFNSMADIIAAIETGKVDSFFGSVCMLEEMARENPNLGILYETLYHADCAYALRKGSGLKEKIDPILDRYREDGTLDKLDKKWRGDDESQKVIDKSGLTGENGTIRYWADGTTPPMDYTDESGEMTGYEVDLMYMIARELGMKIEETVADFDALLAALASGKADAASGTITITEERQQKVDLTVPNYDDQTAALVRKAKMTTAAEQGFFESIADSFYKTFIVEDRWKMILSGLMLTVIISIASAIVGLLLGFCLCMLRRCRVKAVAKAVAIFVRIIQGTPIIVLLMILYYIIFGKVEISGAIIAIVGFAINFAAYSSEIMRSGIEAVDAGQREAALALGFTVKQSFLRVVFPQAATHFIPVLKGEFISMVKMTSVVGYIAVEDLTKISDIIRARTMDAFFPLISTAVIYFVLANLLILVITVFEKKIDVKRRPRRVKL